MKRVIDFHTHCFPDELAPRAMTALRQDALYASHGNGTAGELLTSMRQAGIAHSVVLNIATNPRQNARVNDYAISLLDQPMLIPFGSIHPANPDYRAEVDRLRGAGIKGVKFHPDYQGFFSDDRAVYPVYEYLASAGMIMLFHCGQDLVERDPPHNPPHRFCNVVRDIGGAGAHIVGAHLGGQRLWNDVFKHILGQNVWLDTSFGFKFMSDAQIRYTLDHHDHTKILFATDYPWQNQAVEVAQMQEFVPHSDLLTDILYNNAVALLALHE